MDSKKKSLDWPVALLVVIVICVALFFLGSYWPKHFSLESRVELEWIRSALPTAEAQWQTHGVSDYEVDIRATLHPLICADISKDGTDFVPIHLTIRQGKIIYANEKQKEWVKTCQFESFLPPEVFRTVKRKVETDNSDNVYLKIEFDPTYGFMTEYFLTSNSTISDLYISYRLSNFHPLTTKP